MLEGIELIVFDLDGVLIDSKEGIWYAFQKGLGDIGIKVTKEQLDENIRGYGIRPDVMGLIKNMDPAKRRAMIDEAVDSVRNAKISEGALSKVKVMPEARTVLKVLRERGFLMALVSNSDRPFIEAVLYKFNLHGCWDKIISKEDGFDTKEEALEFLIENFGVGNSQTVYIADMVLDTEAARKVGCKIISKPGWDDENKLKNSKPDYLIKSLKELL